MAVNDTTHAETTTASGDRSSGDNEVTDIEKKGVPGYAHDSTAHRIENVDDEENDPNVHQNMNPKLFMALVCMSFLWCGSQIPLFLFGGVFPLMYSDVGGAERYSWLVIGYLIPVAALCPFVGALSDLFGRKTVAAVGQVLLVIGAIVTSTAKTMNVAIGGMVISGLGAGLNELIALAGTAELVPLRKRGAYVGYIVFTILPFCPSVLWAQLIAAESNWRYVGIFVGAWNFIGLLLVFFAYKDPIRVKRPVKEILGEVDYIGGLLSTIGVTLFMMGLEWGASQYEWTSVHVLVPFCLGVVFIVVFFVWEVYAPHPMLPRAIFSRDKRTMVATLLITFFSGGNFFVVLLFYPTQVYNVYGDDPVGVGVRTLPIGFGIILGAVIGLLMLSISKGRSTIPMIFGCAVMTLGTGLMSYARRDNLGAVYGIISVAALGVGFVIIPCSIIAQIVCPKEYIGTITAITLSIRYVGGAIGYGAYYNIFYSRLTVYLTEKAALAVVRGRIASTVPVITELVTLAAQARFRELDEFIANNPAVRNKETVRGILIPVVQESFALAYRFPYWMSIAFGGVCLVCSFFLRDIRKYF